jgi:large subunit ribosomal protein L7A
LPVWVTVGFLYYNVEKGNTGQKNGRGEGESGKNYVKFVDISEKVIIIIFRMEIQNEVRMAFHEVQAQIGSRKVVVGAKQLRKALASDRVFRVYLAQNADPAITEPLAALCKQHSVDFAWVRTMSDLGRACGIEVGAAAAAALN